MIRAVQLALFLFFTPALATPAPALLRPVYPVLAIGKPGVPSLTHRQFESISIVLHNAYWSARSHHLWFAFDDDTPSGPPIVFFDAGNGYDPHSSKSPVPAPWNGTTYYVVGGGCGIVFSPDKDTAEIFPIPYAGGRGYPQPCYHDPLANPQREKALSPSPPAAPPDRRPRPV